MKPLDVKSIEYDVLSIVNKIQRNEYIVSVFKSTQKTIEKLVFFFEIKAQYKPGAASDYNLLGSGFGTQNWTTPNFKQIFAVKNQDGFKVKGIKCV